MVLVIVVSKKYGVNPDNVATPIAASLGDLITLALLSFFSEFLYDRIGMDVYIRVGLLGISFGHSLGVFFVVLGFSIFMRVGEYV